MSLTLRITLQGDEPNAPEDFLGESLGTVFPDDINNLHGDKDHGVIYTSPHLPKPLVIDLADPNQESERLLFSHYLWNASLQLAEFVEADSLDLALPCPRQAQNTLSFDVKGLDTLELGAGTALPSILGGLFGAHRVVVTDYPAEPVIKTLRSNVARGIQPANSPQGATITSVSSVVVEGHSWGELGDTFSTANQHAFDRIFVADCLWMPHQHTNLRNSIAHFLRKSPDARVFVVAGFHSGRPKMARFFEPRFLLESDLEVEHIWERDCDGDERPWQSDREVGDGNMDKRWLTIASLKWTKTS